MIAFILAVWFALVATSVGGVQYVGELISPTGQRSVVNLRSTPSGTAAPVVPSPTGTTERFYVAITESPAMWRAGGQGLRVRTLYADGREATSNLVLLAAAVPDTFLLDAVGAAWQKPIGWRSLEGNGWQSGWSYAWPCYLRPDVNCVLFARASVADSAMHPPRMPVLNGLGPIVHQEDLQRADRAALCAAYQYWALRGARIPCP